MPVSRPVSMTGPHGLTPGDTFRVHGLHGVFRFCYVWEPDGSVAAWGPLAKGDGAFRTGPDSQFRSFRAERVKVTHR